MNPDYAPIIEIIGQDYEIPQLKRYRRIAAILPHDYYQTDRKYPVLYLHDGQNLFDDKAPFGNWGVDKSLSRMAARGYKDVIIIAIDHGGKERIGEYLPFPDKRFGKAEGELYVDFLLNNLKPYVDKNFRVKTDAQDTGIGGSSMGGLISLYAGLRYPDIFTKMMIFSPSLWIAPDIYQLAFNYQPTHASALYLYSGEQESENHLPNSKKLYSQFLRSDLYRSKFRIEYSINKEGKHSEFYWGLEFPYALRWLFF